MYGPKEYVRFLARVDALDATGRAGWKYRAEHLKNLKRLACGNCSSKAVRPTGTCGSSPPTPTTAPTA